MLYEKIGADKKHYQARARELVSKMTVKEKCHLLAGNWRMIGNAIKHKNVYNPTPIKSFGCKRLGVPGIGFSDGPRGVVMNGGTCFPVSMARGASFDRSLEREIGAAIGKEVRSHEGGNYFAGVCINLLRHPAWGRAQETYGEDAYHVGEFGLKLTEAVQEHGVMACVKHYALNNIENSRFKVDVQVDDRSLHEIYLPHFKKCVVDGGAASLMGAYNKFRGEQVCESKELMTDILRDMWGFEGFVSSDFIFGIRDAKKAIEAGMDMEMPAPVHYGKKMIKKVKSGKINESDVDICCERVVATTLAFEEKADKMFYGEHHRQHADHIALARRAAEESMTLIKNENNVLPLSKDVKKVLLVGEFAMTPNLGDKGSSKIEPKYAITPYEGIRNILGYDAEILTCGDKDIEKARKLAAEVDAVIVFAGCDFSDEGEFLVPDEDVDYGLIGDSYTNRGNPVLGTIVKIQTSKGQDHAKASDEEGMGLGGDRADLGIRPSQVRMIQAIGRINPNTVVNLIAGSMLMTDEWDDQAPAILYNWYSGMEGGNALASILFGDVNPSGKTPFSTPYTESHLCRFDNTVKAFSYDYYHGYFLLDKMNVEPMYPFGHGLSYTTFTQANHAVETLADRFRVTVDVTNTGDMAGKEVIQVYAGYSQSVVERHKKELRGFEKVHLDAGETKTVTVDVLFKELKYFSPPKNEFVFEKIDYELYVGNSSSEETLTKLVAKI